VERREELDRERALVAAAFSVTPKRLSLGAVLALITGLLPVGFVVAASALIAHAPGAIRAGYGSHAWHTEELYLAVLLGLFFVQQLAAPVGEVIRSGITGRVDGAMRERLMVAASLPDGIGAFEDEAVVDTVRDAVDGLRSRTWGPGAAVAAFLPLARRYVQAVGGAIVVSVASVWWAGVAVLVAGVTIRTGYRRCGARFVRAQAGYARGRRRRSYIARLMFSSGAAKEIRVFGLLDWLLARHKRLALVVVEPLWRLRRETFLTPFIGYGVISATVLAAAFAYSADAAARGALSLGAWRWCSRLASRA
jgi:ATP-binding cassette, subfamily B, bacterial